MADYNGGEGLDTMLDNYISYGGRVLFLGYALDEGPQDVGLTSQSSSSGSMFLIEVEENEHYITQDYDEGDDIWIMMFGATRSLRSDYTGEELASTGWWGIEQTILGDGDGYMVWGPRTPSLFTASGMEITTKVLDHNLMESTVSPG